MCSTELYLWQFLLLQLTRPAIVHKITFGKYENRHVCNVKKLEVYGGIEEDHMSMLWEGQALQQVGMLFILCTPYPHSGLQNNSQPETFQLRHSLDGHVFPCNFIKICKDAIVTNIQWLLLLLFSTTAVVGTEFQLQYLVCRVMGFVQSSGDLIST